MIHSYQERVVFWGVPSALIVLGCCYAPQIGNRLVLLLGAASYSIYLVQAMSIPLFFKVSRAFDVPQSLGAETAAAGLLFTVVAGTFLHLLYERPVDGWLRRTFSRSAERRVAPGIEGRHEAFRGRSGA
jgi:peptidoglycan/LPS O-acetylase OafA/YrhL